MPADKIIVVFHVKDFKSNYMLPTTRRAVNFIDLPIFFECLCKRRAHDLQVFTGYILSRYSKNPFTRWVNQHDVEIQVGYNDATLNICKNRFDKVLALHQLQVSHFEFFFRGFPLGNIENDTVNKGRPAFQWPSSP